MDFKATPIILLKTSYILKIQVILFIEYCVRVLSKVLYICNYSQHLHSIYYALNGDLWVYIFHKSLHKPME